MCNAAARSGVPPSMVICPSASAIASVCNFDLCTLALVDANVSKLLVVVGSAKILRLGIRDGGVAIDQLLHRAAYGFEVEQQRGDLDQRHALHLRRPTAGHNGGLYGSSIRDRPIGGDILAQLFSPKHPETMDCTLGIRVEPPTSTTSAMALLARPLSVKH